MSLPDSHIPIDVTNPLTMTSLEAMTMTSLEVPPPDTQGEVTSPVCLYIYINI